VEWTGIEPAERPRSGPTWPIIKHTTEIEYEGIEPSSTCHVLDARFSQASVFYGGPHGNRTRNTHHTPRKLGGR
jgi:hypothetical protein